MPPHQPQLPPSVTELLGRLRRKIRRYVWWEGLTSALAWLGVAFWITLAVDWFFEPPASVRVGMLIAVGLVLAWVLVQLVVRRVLARLTDDNMAMLLERCFPQFQDSLLTAVELTGRKADPSECHPDMLARACRQAAEPVGQVQLQQVFNPVPLRRSTIAAVLLACSIGMYAVETPEGLAVWAQRQLRLADVLWPRNTHLEVEGFNEANDFTVKVAKGTDLEVIAKADLSWPVAPQTVQVRYRTEGGARDRRTMSREGTADPEKDAFQQYSYTFRGVPASIDFDVVGGDDAVRGLRIEVVDSPTIVKMELDCEYPPYLARPRRTLPVTASVMPIPAGTQVTVRAETNKDLVRVDVQFPMDGSVRPAVLLEPLKPPDPNWILGPDSEGRWIYLGKAEIVKNRIVLRPDEAPAMHGAFQYNVGKLTDDKTLLFTLHDTDGIRTREPIRLTLARLDDKPPELSVQLRGIGPAITARAMLPAVGRATDDYGIAKLWFEYAIDQGKPSEQSIAIPAKNPTDLAIKQALDVRPLNLTPGRKLLVTLKAADHCNLSQRPNVGSSQRWLLDVVAPEQLRAMLEARELALRQRFAAVIQEVEETRDSLARVEFPPPPASGASVGRIPNSSMIGPSPPILIAASGAKGEGPKGTEPGDKPESKEDASPQRLSELRMTRVQRALQYSHKNANETLGVAESFSDIREELVNNRIDTEELNRRLKEGIADPLKDIAERMFPELDRRLEQLLKDIDDAKAGPAGRNQAIQQVDAILSAMRQVLDRMVELEDFNEAIEKLRSIIQEQEKLGELIKQRQKQKLRDLMEK